MSALINYSLYITINDFQIWRLEVGEISLIMNNVWKFWSVTELCAGWANHFRKAESGYSMNEIDRPVEEDKFKQFFM
jgi:hypothetical protein